MCIRDRAPLMRNSGFFNRWVEAGVLFSGVSSLMNSQINQLLAPQNRQSWPITPNGVDTDYWSSPAPALGSASGHENIDRPGSPITANDPNLEVPANNTFHAVSAIRLMPRKRPLALIKFTERVNRIPVSYTHLTLPTKRIV